MHGSVRLAALSGACATLLAACSGAATPTAGATATPAAGAATQAISAAPSSSPTPPGPTTADLRAVYERIYPGSGDCLSSTGASPALATCPFTPRLAAQVASALNNPAPGGGADPVCGCQAFDTQQTAMYVPETPAGGGTIRVVAFGELNVEYVVIPSGGGFLVDDIVYCAQPHSVYPSETGVSC